MKTFLKAAIICLSLFNILLSQEMTGMSNTLGNTEPEGQYNQFFELLTQIFGNGTLNMLNPQNNGTYVPSPTNEQSLCGVSVNTTSFYNMISPKSIQDCTNDKKSTLGSCCQVQINSTDINVNICGVLTESNVKNLNNEQNKVLFRAFGIQTDFKCSAVKLVSSVLVNLLILILLI
jgi:hypothetical protein